MQLIDGTIHSQWSMDLLMILCFHYFYTIPYPDYFFLGGIVETATIVLLDCWTVSHIEQYYPFFTTMKGPYTILVSLHQMINHDMSLSITIDHYQRWFLTINHYQPWWIHQSYTLSSVLAISHEHVWALAKDWWFQICFPPIFRDDWLINYCFIGQTSWPVINSYHD